MIESIIDFLFSGIGARVLIKYMDHLQKQVNLALTKQGFGQLQDMLL